LDQSANAILIASKRPTGHHAVCLALATTRLDVNHRVRAEMGVKKLSFASQEATEELTGMMLGGVTPFGLPEDLPLLVDAAVTACERVIVGGGNRATKVFVDPEVFARMPNTRIVEGLAQPTGA
jgi:prolyl-tRNA editing enzyme YbaK/EbsC (Cys-tRNA(Pro) deacylase)